MKNRYFFYQDMPINENGDGPATDEETVAILHEVWTDDFLTFCQCQSKQDAELVARALNKYEEE
jgi:hypothetical protein